MNPLRRLLRLEHEPNRQVLGLMSGTSVDGVDAALVEVSGLGERVSVRLRAAASYPFPDRLRERVFANFDPVTSRVDELCRLDFLLGELFARAALRLLEDAGVRPQDVDLVGAAGQTVWHEPRPVVEKVDGWLEEPLRTRSSLAIGQSSVIAERTGITTVGDLRVRDIAAGGQGAPLIAYADWVLLRHSSRGRCIQNIGGMGNVTYLPPDASLNDVIAFDTGPGNVLIDALVELATRGECQFDLDGRLAAAGTVRQEIVDQLMSNAYFDLAPPKTTGRERFGMPMAHRLAERWPDLSVEDLVATVTDFTARSIARSYRDWVLPRGPVDEVIVGGGGARNPTLLRMLRRALPEPALLTHEEVGIDSKAKEAMGIAVIADAAVRGLHTNVPGATGGRPTVLGKISL